MEIFSPKQRLTCSEVNLQSTIFRSGSSRIFSLCSLCKNISLITMMAWHSDHLNHKLFMELLYELHEKNYLDRVCQHSPRPSYTYSSSHAYKNSWITGSGGFFFRRTEWVRWVHSFVYLILEFSPRLKTECTTWQTNFWGGNLQYCVTVKLQNLPTISTKLRDLWGVNICE